jgi:GTP-binding protein
MGVTAQDKRIAGLIQKAQKPAIIILNKWDLVRSEGGQKHSTKKVVDDARGQIFFLEYAPMLITSALTGENVERLFVSIAAVQRATQKHIGTGILNRLLRHALEVNPPPMIKGRRLKLLYATQSSGNPERRFQPPEFILFVNDPRLISETYRRYLESRIRKAEAYPGLPLILTLRPRTQRAARPSRAQLK